MDAGILREVVYQVVNDAKRSKLQPLQKSHVVADLAVERWDLDGDPRQRREGELLGERV